VFNQLHSLKGFCYTQEVTNSCLDTHVSKFVRLHFGERIMQTDSRQNLRNDERPLFRRK